MRLFAFVAISTARLAATASALLFSVATAVFHCGRLALAAVLGRTAPLARTH